MALRNLSSLIAIRWSELVSTLKFHAELAHAAKAPTQFRFLNNCEPIMVGTDDDLEGDALAAALMVSSLIHLLFCDPLLPVPAHCRCLDSLHSFHANLRLALRPMLYSLHPTPLTADFRRREPRRTDAHLPAALRGDRVHSGAGGGTAKYGP
jgi:hypothetical protein